MLNGVCYTNSIVFHVRTNFTRFQIEFVICCKFSPASISAGAWAFSDSIFLFVSSVFLFISIQSFTVGFHPIQNYWCKVIKWNECVMHTHCRTENKHTKWKQASQKENERTIHQRTTATFFSQLNFLLFSIFFFFLWLVFVLLRI